MSSIASSQITREYYKSGYWAILQTPKHILNAVVLHLVARALRWHIDRMLGVNFAAGDEGMNSWRVEYGMLGPRLGHGILAHSRNFRRPRASMRSIQPSSKTP
ncbi:hypothetical protein Esi_0072_0024 [Ectocarpus siliculosus]|uniref:Uncharacterized protein n=1 Tax=Ectocarpus siliculosus TaxID=2880 RepID=D8LSC9_ECTSI|nr:hypothetical protein Esi_0072_0024 [Ectocarpus siliculosus]|eukprot:CBN75186.1 hypothetical protein Esi_0072_0024 [Ectocarpus siliculosus]